MPGAKVAVYQFKLIVDGKEAETNLRSFAKTLRDTMMVQSPVEGTDKTLNQLTAMAQAVHGLAGPVDALATGWERVSRAHTTIQGSATRTALIMKDMVHSSITYMEALGYTISEVFYTGLVGSAQKASDEVVGHSIIPNMLNKLKSLLSEFGMQGNIPGVGLPMRPLAEKDVEAAMRANQALTGRFTERYAGVMIEAVKALRKLLDLRILHGKEPGVLDQMLKDPQTFDVHELSAAFSDAYKDMAEAASEHVISVEAVIPALREARAAQIRLAEAGIGYAQRGGIEVIRPGADRVLSEEQKEDVANYNELAKIAHERVRAYERLTERAILAGKKLTSGLEDAPSTYDAIIDKMTQIRDVQASIDRAAEEYRGMAQQVDDQEKILASAREELKVLTYRSLLMQRAEESMRTLSDLADSLVVSGRDVEAGEFFAGIPEDSDIANAHEWDNVVDDITETLAQLYELAGGAKGATAAEHLAAFLSIEDPAGVRTPEMVNDAATAMDRAYVSTSELIDTFNELQATDITTISTLEKELEGAKEKLDVLRPGMNQSIRLHTELRAEQVKQKQAAEKVAEAMEFAQDQQIDLTKTMQQVVKERIQAADQESAELKALQKAEKNIGVSQKQRQKARVNGIVEQLQYLDTLHKYLQTIDSDERRGAIARNRLQASGIDYIEVYRRSLNAISMQYRGLWRMGVSMQQIGRQITQTGQRALTFFGEAMDQYREFNRVATLTASAMQLPIELQGEFESLLQDTAIAMKAIPAEDLAEGLRLWAAGTGEVVKTTEQLNRIMEDAVVLQNLARINAEEFASTATITGAVMGEFGLNIKDIADVTEILNYAAARSFATLGEVGATFKEIGPTAADLGVSMETLAAATALLADSGIRGTKSGRALRQMFVQMLRPTDAHNKAMNKALGFSEELGMTWQSIVFPAGEFIDLAGYVDILAKATENMSDKQRQSLLATIATANELPVITTLVTQQIRARKEGISVLRVYEKVQKGLIDEEVRGYAKLSEAFKGIPFDLKSARETMEEQLERLTDSTSEKLDQIERRYEKASLSVGKSLQSLSLVALEPASRTIEKIANLLDSHPGLAKWAAGVAGLTATAGIAAQFTGGMIRLVEVGLTIGAILPILKAAGTQWSSFANVIGDSATLSNWQTISKNLAKAGPWLLKAGGKLLLAALAYEALRQTFELLAEFDYKKGPFDPENIKQSKTIMMGFGRDLKGLYSEMLYDLTHILQARFQPIEEQLELGGFIAQTKEARDVMATMYGSSRKVLSTMEEVAAVQFALEAGYVPVRVFDVNTSAIDDWSDLSKMAVDDIVVYYADKLKEGNADIAADLNQEFMTYEEYFAPTIGIPVEFLVPDIDTINIEGARDEIRRLSQEIGESWEGMGTRLVKNEAWEELYDVWVDFWTGLSKLDKNTRASLIESGRKHNEERLKAGEKYNEDSNKRQKKYDEDLEDLNRAHLDNLSDANRDFEDSKVKSMEDMLLSIIEMNRNAEREEIKQQADFARDASEANRDRALSEQKVLGEFRWNQAKAERALAEKINEDYRDYLQKRTRLIEDFHQDASDEYDNYRRDIGDKLREWAIEDARILEDQRRDDSLAVEEHLHDHEENERDHADKVLDIKEDYYDKLRELQEEHDRKMRDLLLSRDVKALADELEDFRISKAKATKNRDDNLKDERSDYRKGITELEKDFERKQKLEDDERAYAQQRRADDREREIQESLRDFELDRQLRTRDFEEQLREREEDFKLARDGRLRDQKNKAEASERERVHDSQVRADAFETKKAINEEEFQYEKGQREEQLRQRVLDVQAERVLDALRAKADHEQKLDRMEEEGEERREALAREFNRDAIQLGKELNDLNDIREKAHDRELIQLQIQAAQKEAILSQNVATMTNIQLAYMRLNEDMTAAEIASMENMTTKYLQFADESKAWADVLEQEYQRAIDAWSRGDPFEFDLSRYGTMPPVLTANVNTVAQLVPGPGPERYRDVRGGVQEGTGGVRGIRVQIDQSNTFDSSISQADRDALADMVETSTEAGIRKAFREVRR